MAENTLTGLIPDIYEAMDVVSRELTGMIPAVTLSASAQTAAVGQNITVDIEPDYAAGVDITPAMQVPEPTGETSGTTQIVISKSKAYEFGFTGEAQQGLNTGAGYANVRSQKIAQRIRTLVNEVESDLCGLQSTFSRAYGTAGTTPFGTAGDFTDASFVKKILVDNGAPEFDNSLVLNTSAGATLQGRQASAVVTSDMSLQRQGVLLPLSGLDLRQSAQIKNFTAGSFTSGTLTSAVRAVGTTVLEATADYTAGLGLGDVITIAGDTNKYVVQSVAAGAITIAAPGLRVATAASGTKAITLIASSARNMAFNRSAIVLAARAPIRPAEGDSAVDVMTITDPRSGLSFEFSMYKGYRKVRYEIALAWGVKNIKPAHTALLLG